MGCSRCRQNRKRPLQQRRLIDQKKRERLAEACMAGDQRSCMELQDLIGAQQYREQNSYQNEFHTKRRKTDLERGQFGRRSDNNTGGVQGFACRGRP